MNNARVEISTEFITRGASNPSHAKSPTHNRQYGCDPRYWVATFSGFLSAANSEVEAR
jgi:hypothetical protein